MAEPRDWTFVIENRCAECGFDPSGLATDGVAEQVRQHLPRYVSALEHRDAPLRPDESTWSAVEYGQHIADVAEVMAQRLRLILDAEGAPAEFDSWDPDQAAADNEYHLASAEITTLLVRERFAAAATAWDEPAGDQWTWPGMRGDGFRFTAATLGRYFVHELQHHLADASKV